MDYLNQCLTLKSLFKDWNGAYGRRTEEGAMYIRHPARGCCRDLVAEILSGTVGLVEPGCTPEPRSVALNHESSF